MGVVLMINRSVATGDEFKRVRKPQVDIMVSRNVKGVVEKFNCERECIWNSFQTSVRFIPAVKGNGNSERGNRGGENAHLQDYHMPRSNKHLLKGAKPIGTVTQARRIPWTRPGSLHTPTQTPNCFLMLTPSR